MAGQQIEIMGNRVEGQGLGFMALSLTNFAANNTTAPEIEAGSIVEVGGALFEFVANESITGFAALGGGSDAYIKLVVLGTTVTAEYTAVAPAWSASKNGWYDGNDRYIGAFIKTAQRAISINTSITAVLYSSQLIRTLKNAVLCT